MKIIRDSGALSAGGAVAAIGNFDGVHRGHIAVIEEARSLSQSHGAPLGVLTFEPHPRELFHPKAPPFRLMRPVTRAHRLERLGVEALIELPFDRAFAALSAEAFLQDILIKQLKLGGVVVGEDFCYGAGREGNAARLIREGREAGLEVRALALIGGERARISSTAIRQALSDGRPREAAEMLGHWHRIDGVVEHGEKRGRTLNYPTANLSLTGLHLPRLGVYAVQVEVLSGPHQGRYDGVASLGIRPMFNGATPNLESHLFDFQGDLYGAEISVGLIEFLRDEARFDSIDALVAAMDNDSARARDVLGAL